VGTVVSISGAFLVTFYKGAPIRSFQTWHSTLQPLVSLLEETSNWVIGGLFLTIASISLAAWNIAQVRYLLGLRFKWWCMRILIWHSWAYLQAAILKGYPSQLTIVAFYCLFGTFQCAILSLIVVKDPSSWKLSLDIELISIIYSVSK
jgi:hypothetical protein